MGWERIFHYPAAAVFSIYINFYWDNYSLTVANMKILSWSSAHGFVPAYPID